MGKKIFLTLLSLGLLSWLSHYRTALPASLEQATFFAPRHLIAAYRHQDVQALEVFRQMTIQRPGLGQQPWLAVYLPLHSLLLLYFLKKS